MSWLGHLPNTGLDVAGPLIDLDPAAALAAAPVHGMGMLVRCFPRRAAGTSVSHSCRPCRMPKTPAAHLSIDLTLRYAVTVYRRAHAQNADDVLVTRLAEAFRRCPLTGVLVRRRRKPRRATSRSPGTPA